MGATIFMLVFAACTGAVVVDSSEESGVSAPDFLVEGGRFSSLSVGAGVYAGVCVLDESGFPRCWGVPDGAGHPCVAPPARLARQVVHGSHAICVLTESGGVECAEAYPSSGRVPPVLDGTFASIDHSGTLICGVGEDGAMCSADLTCGPAIPAMKAPTSVTVNWGSPGYACALDAGGTFRCWGNYPLSHCDTSEEAECECSPLDPVYEAGPYTQATRGLCGLRPDATIDCPLSTVAPPSGEYSSIGGRNFPAAVRTDGGIVYWDHEDVDPSALETPDGEFLAVDTGWDLTCGLFVEGGLACWGLRVDEFRACE